MFLTNLLTNHNLDIAVWFAIVTFLIQAVLCIPMVLFEYYQSNKNSLASIKEAHNGNFKSAGFKKFLSVHAISTGIFFVWLFLYSVYNAVGLIHHLAINQSGDLAFLVIGGIITFFNTFGLFYIGFTYLFAEIKRAKLENSQIKLAKISQALFEIFIAFIIISLSLLLIIATFAANSVEVSAIMMDKIKYSLLFLMSTFAIFATIFGAPYIFCKIKTLINDYRNKVISKTNFAFTILQSLFLWIIIANFAIITLSVGLLVIWG